MTFATAGIHHVTAITSDQQRNLDFYAGILGLRLVKRTVNFDDPTTYHFYFGDESGSPGSLITFFAWRPPRAAGSGAGWSHVLLDPTALSRILDRAAHSLSRAVRAAANALR
jgi:glyoxalase family protein